MPVRLKVLYLLLRECVVGAEVRRLCCGAVHRIKIRGKGEDSIYYFDEKGT
jgi:hypothetical protein